MRLLTYVISQREGCVVANYDNKRQALLDYIESIRLELNDAKRQLAKLEEEHHCPKDNTCQYNDFTHGCQKCHPTFAVKNGTP